MPWSRAPPSLYYVPGLEHPPSLDYVPDPEYSEYLVPSDDEGPNEDLEEDPAGYLADGGYDDDDEEEEESFEDDDVDEEDEASDDEDEENLAPADSTTLLAIDPVPLAEDTKAFETDESAPTPPPPRSPRTKVPFAQTRLRRARKTVGPQPPMTTFAEALIAEYASAPTPPSPPPSPLSPLSSPLPRIPSPPTHTSPTYAEAPLGYRAAMIRSRADKDDIPEVDMSAVATARKAEHADNAQIIHVFYGVICIFLSFLVNFRYLIV
ncbi:hypothetical protein Tco_0634870 [Tanacetum coccineum]